MLNLTNTSKNMIKQYSKQVENCKYKFKTGEKREFDKYIKNFLIEIKIADEKLKQNIKECKIHKANIKCVGKLGYDISYFPVQIKKFIETTKCTKITFNMKIDKRDIYLNFYLYANEKNIFQYAYMAFIWFYIAGKYAVGNCSRVLNVDIYLTRFKKELPKKKKILDCDNANTAFTYSNCSDRGVIIVYRKEEWYKVLIHETFHNFNLDFSAIEIDNIKKRMSRTFKISSDFHIAEIYCETWARILNVFLVSYYSSNNKSTHSYINVVNDLLQIERLYTLNQCNKILDYNNINLDILLNYTNNPYKEKTNIFCYYIGVAILMNNYYEYIVWCSKYNTNFLQFNNKIRNLDLFVNFITSEVLITGLEENLDCLKKDRTKSLRMSAIEI